MSRVDDLAAHLALLPPDQFVSAIGRAIKTERKALVALGLDGETAQIAAQSIVAQAAMQAKRLEDGSLSELKTNLSALGVMLN